MRGKHITQRWQLTVLGIVLCLLAALFAIEAKMAWFGPAGSAAVHVSSSKLQPADAPKLIAQALAPTHTAAWFPQFASLLLIVLIWQPMGRLPRPVRVLRVPGSPGFASSLFFRPPPSL